jgi:3-phenylpropionate/trans-cinnamate dioxygenase ferredoxin subunit
MSDWVDVVDQSELGPGQTKLVDMDETMVAVFNIDGEYYAIEDICTHDGSPLLGCGLAPEELVDGNEIICPRHGARFSIKSGEALSPPAYEPTTCFPTRVESGIVQVRDNRWD